MFILVIHPILTMYNTSYLQTNVMLNFFRGEHRQSTENSKDQAVLKNETRLIILINSISGAIFSICLKAKRSSQVLQNCFKKLIELKIFCIALYLSYFASKIVLSKILKSLRKKYVLAVYFGRKDWQRGVVVHYCTTSFN